MRAITPTDSAALFEVFSDAEAMAYYGPDMPHQSIEQTAKLIEELQEYENTQPSIR